MDGAPNDAQRKYQRYLLSIIVMQIVVAMFVLGMSALVVASYYQTVNNQNVLLNCTDQRRIDSECQTYQNTRTKRAVQVLQRVTAAYIICADEYDGEAAIQRCVKEKL